MGAACCWRRFREAERSWRGSDCSGEKRRERRKKGGWDAEILLSREKDNGEMPEVVGGWAESHKRQREEFTSFHSYLENNDEDIIGTLMYVSIKISLWEAVTRFEPLAKKPKSVY